MFHAGATTAGAVRVWLVTDKMISARIRDDDRIFDVYWSRLLGWSCTCQADNCDHRAAVELVTATAAGGCQRPGVS
jgi:hypothetical protein